jgi:RNA polymerase sigma-70 factor (ECF subfamily)
VDILEHKDKVSISKFDKSTDEELVEMFKNSHDNLYIGELYIRYTDLVYGVCLKYLQDKSDAQDATMQVFEKLIADLKKQKIATFKPWLYAVVKNYCMMEFRKSSAHQKNEKAYMQVSRSVEKEERLHLEDHEDKEVVLKQLEIGISSLSDAQQKCIKMFYLSEKSYKEIAEETGYSMNDVKSHIQNGKRNLKNHIMKH